jgi:hypothetical protein
MRIAEGTITFQYDLDGEYGIEDMDDTEKLQYFTDLMVDDIIDYSYSDLAPAIEMSIKNV